MDCLLWHLHLFEKLQVAIEKFIVAFLFLMVFFGKVDKEVL